MSRIAKRPLEIPKEVQFSVQNDLVHIKGKKGEFTYQLHDAVALQVQGNSVQISAKKAKHPMVGTTRILLENMVIGVSQGFKRKLQLVGVGYRAKAQNNILELSLGFSHPVQYGAPVGITFETPSNTEVVIEGVDKQVVGETAAKIRAIRPPEVYKGKGVRYENEVVNLKETKKK